MLRPFFVLLLMSYVYNVTAQLTQTTRYENEIKFTDDNFIVASAQEDGILLIRESDEKVEDERGEVWEVISLDNELQELWQNLFVIDQEYDVLGFEYYKGFLYLLFEDQDGSTKKFFLLKINQKTGDVNKYEAATELELMPTHLLITDDQMVLGGEINYRLSFVIFNYVEDQVAVVPGFFNRKSIILDFNFNEQHKVYSLLLLERNAQNKNEIAIKSFTREGKVFIDEQYEFDGAHRALNGKIVIGEDMRVYFSGTYGSNNSFYSQGMYFGYLQGGQEPKVELHSLNELEHIFDYMKEKRAKKLRAKIERRKNKRKPYEFKTQLWTQYFYEVEGKNQFVMLADIFRPEYDRQSDMRMGTAPQDDNTNQKYVSYISGITNADGSDNIKYYESVMVVFNNEGEIINDYSLPTPNVEGFSLDRFSCGFVDEDEASLFYKDENNIRYKVFDHQQNVLRDSIMQISLLNEQMIPVKMTDIEGRVQPWYDDKLFVWGYQKVEDSVGDRKTLFFINKLELQ